jgi:hypothetical protein
MPARADENEKTIANIISHLSSIQYDGATNLGAKSFARGEYDFCLLFSDGFATLGMTAAKELFVLFYFLVFLVFFNIVSLVCWLAFFVVVICFCLWFTSLIGPELPEKLENPVYTFVSSGTLMLEFCFCLVEYYHLLLVYSIFLS